MLERGIREKARGLGFSACRYTHAEPPGAAAHFRDWLRRGYQGGMSYLERTAPKRCDPRLVLDSVQSLVLVSLDYAAPERTGAGLRLEGEHSGAGRPSWTGYVAAYARYRDYHQIMGEKLQALADFLCVQAGPKIRALWYVDTGPLLERDLAQRAGLGFAGKHTNLIRPDAGNYFFLGAILTNARLTPDVPERSRCGRCERCLAACPTGAIRAPYVLDARRCLSYLTIEWKGAIPEEYRTCLGTRIFGCDDCLTVCPWNRFARESQVLGEQARSDLRAPDLVDLLRLGEGDFRVRFGHTPLARLKRWGLLRNVCVALGNVADERVLPLLAETMRGAEPLVAEHARWAIRQIESRRSR
ncbi:MAG TPA: tRNA epoxyqueuosine(34) reductase QueG [Candidatus Paceibacterota bacterium]|nr:tRNA epoxyqueuosine(34) reductase QueG [Candidatus Paceibacterota bacterium]